MRQINPLYISLLLVVVLMIVFVKLGNTKEDYNDSKNDLKKTEVMAKRIIALKKDWGEDKNRQETLIRVLNASVLSEADLKRRQEGDVMTITSKKADAKAVEFLLNKLMNGTYAIKTMRIRALDANSASIHVEIML